MNKKAKQKIHPVEGQTIQVWVGKREVVKGYVAMFV